MNGFKWANPNDTILNYIKIILKSKDKTEVGSAKQYLKKRLFKKYLEPILEKRFNYLTKRSYKKRLRKMRPITKQIDLYQRKFAAICVMRMCHKSSVYTIHEMPRPTKEDEKIMSKNFIERLVRFVFSYEYIRDNYSKETAQKALDLGVDKAVVSFNYDEYLRDFLNDEKMYKASRNSESTEKVGSGKWNDYSTVANKYVKFYSFS